MSVSLAKHTDTPRPILRGLINPALGEDWHAYGGIGWQIITEPTGGFGPAFMWVTRELMMPVVYRHRASNCHGSCPMGQ